MVCEKVPDWEVKQSTDQYDYRTLALVHSQPRILEPLAISKKIVHFIGQFRVLSPRSF